MASLGRGIPFRVSCQTPDVKAPENRKDTDDTRLNLKHTAHWPLWVCTPALVAWTSFTDRHSPHVTPQLHLEWGERFEWPDEGRNDMGDGVFCHGMGDHFGILCDGTVIPCCLDADGVINLGNVHERPLKEIIEGERAMAIREGFKCKKAVEELCKRCPYARRFKI